MTSNLSMKYQKDIKTIRISNGRYWLSEDICLADTPTQVIVKFEESSGLNVPWTIPTLWYVILDKQIRFDSVNKL